MSNPTPYYDPALILDLYGKMSTIVDQIGAMKPLPFGQFATDSYANRNIVRRHRALLAQAGALKGELYELVSETATAEILRRSG